jgi:GTPase SAR1 family protein
MPRLAEELSRRLAVFAYKQQTPYLWVVFLGGTGTGKSTLFNALLGSEVSQTGVERPKTRGPISYAHRGAPIEANFPFPAVQVDRSPAEDAESVPAEGAPGRLLVLEHHREDYAQLVLVDTPDLDSVEVENRRLAEHLYLLADIVIFVTSQEKYADEVPYQYLLQTVQERRPYVVLLNKADSSLTPQEVTASFGDHGVSVPEERLWLIPYVPSSVSRVIPEAETFRSFLDRFSCEVAHQARETSAAHRRSERAGDVQARADRLCRALEAEEHAAQQWLDRLEGLGRTISRELMERQKQRFAAMSKDYLQNEIRKLYTRYDVLAKPRRFVRELLLTPLRLLGLKREEDKAAHDEALRRVRQKIDPAIVQASVEKFNRAVLDELSPGDASAPLAGEIRRPGLPLTAREIEQRLEEQQARLTAWLEETFARLARGLPAEKRLGIYSTSVLWGVLVLAFETAIGGGFSLVDAALDTVLAPFVTKGAVELFAYYEIEKIAKQLAARYQEALTSVVREQRDRYRDCLERLRPPAEAIKTLEALRVGFSAGKS